VNQPAAPRTGLVAWLARGFIAATRGLSPERALPAGAAIGRAWARLGGPRVDVARTNLELCFPERDRAWREDTLLASFANLGRSLAEVVLLQGRHRASLLERVSIEGLEHLEAARKASPAGGGFILTAHFGSWELGGAVFADRGYPMTSVHRARGDQGLEQLVTSWRESSGQQVVPLGAAGISVLRAVRRGRLVMMLIDQNARRDEGLFAPFFGIPASTRFGPAHLAAQLGVPVIPAFIHRVGETGEHIGRIHPALELQPESGSEETQARILAENVSAMNRALEDAVRADPTQWVWTHRRFRTRPAGQARLYPERTGLFRRLRHTVR